MKVGIYETVEVSDEQRKQIATILGQTSATRDDLKAYIWQQGRDWERSLDAPVNPEPDDQDELEFEDLI